MIKTAQWFRSNLIFDAIKNSICIFFNRKKKEIYMYTLFVSKTIVIYILFLTLFAAILDYIDRMNRLAASNCDSFLTSVLGPHLRFYYKPIVRVIIFPNNNNKNHSSLHFIVSERLTLIL